MQSDPGGLFETKEADRSKLPEISRKTSGDGKQLYKQYPIFSSCDIAPGHSC